MPLPSVERGLTAVRPVAAAAVAAAAVLVAAAGAGAASAPLPSPRTFLLAPSDFGSSAKADDLKPVKADGLTEYVRGFSNHLRAGSQPLDSAVSAALVAPNAVTASEVYQEVEIASHTVRGRRMLAQEFGAGYAAKAARAATTTVGTPRYEVDTVILPVVLKTSGGSTRVLLAITHVERVVGMLVLVSFTGRSIPTAAVDVETAAMRKHLTDAFTVANTGLPTISGSTVQGQTLTVDEGGWSGAPTSYTYAWSRCADGTCTPIDGATAGTYVVGTADSGATLEVAVTAANTVGSATASASPTAVVQ